MPAPPSVLTPALAAAKHNFIAAGVFSLFINLLLLAPSVYMLQVYDRVLTSRNETTLWLVTVLLVVVYAIIAALEWVRGGLLSRAGALLDHQLDDRVFDAAFEANLRRGGGDTRQALGDLDTLRQFLGGKGLTAFFDAPWTPIFLAASFFLHPVLGWVALGGMLLLVGLTLMNEWATRSVLAEANQAGIDASRQAQRNLANAEVIEALGMLGSLRTLWSRQHATHRALHQQAGDRGNIIGNISRFIRLCLQSSTLGVGAWLVLRGEMSPGAMIAASLLMGRALGPVEALIGNWRTVLSARLAHQRLEKLLGRFPQRAAGMPLPAPTGALTVEGLIAAPPGAQVATLKGIAFALPAGTAVAVLGPSGAGKSTLARLLVGVWAPLRGHVRLDGADVARWSRAELGPHLGYLPQDVELFDGSIAQNIARFGEVDADEVVAAARRAGVHDLILALPEGYDTRIGHGGLALSGGQRQRIGLARALYGAPALVVLDEPNSNLDEAGEMALMKAVHALKKAGTTVVVISHRMSVLAAVDQIMLLRDGTLQALGPRDEIIKSMQAARPQRERPAATLQVAK